MSLIFLNLEKEAEKKKEPRMTREEANRKMRLLNEKLFGFSAQSNIQNSKNDKTLKNTDELLLETPPKFPPFLELSNEDTNAKIVNKPESCYQGSDLFEEHLTNKDSIEIEQPKKLTISMIIHYFLEFKS